MAGSRSRYDPKRTPALARGLALTGRIDTEIADMLGITPATLYNWRKRHPEFAEALDAAKDSVDQRVENALLRNAIGYEVEEIHVEGPADEQGRPIPGRPMKIHKTRKHVPPNTTAQIFWLKNRQPGKWRDQRDHKVEGKVATWTIADAVKDVVNGRGIAETD